MSKQLLSLMKKVLTQQPKSALPTLIGVFMAIGLTACVSSGDLRSGAVLRSGTDFASAKSLPEQSGQWPAVDWPRQIGGEPLQALVDEAVADNPGLQAAQTRLVAAQALADATRAAAGPSVGGSFTSTYQRYSENGIIPPPLGGMRKLDNQLLASFKYDVDFWDKHGAEMRAVLAQGKATEAEQYSARMMLASAVVQSWLQLGRSFQQRDLVQQQVALREQLDALTDRRIAAGLDTQTDRQLGKIQLENLRAEQMQWDGAIAVGRNQLAALLGKGPDRGASISRPAATALTSLALPNALPSDLLGRRPDIVAARWRVEALQGEVDTARASFYPNIDLNGFAGLSSLGLGNLLKPGSLIVGIGPAIHLPIFEGGALRAQLKGKLARYDAAVETYNQTLVDALRDVADQVQSLRIATQQSTHQLSAVQASDAAFKLAQQRRKVGTGNQLQVIAAQATLLQQRRTALDAELRVIDLDVALIKALGGGFDAAPAGLNLPATLNTPSTISTTDKSAS